MRSVVNPPQEANDKARQNCQKQPFGHPGLGLCTFTAVDMGLIPGRGTKILHAKQPWPKKKKKI